MKAVLKFPLNFGMNTVSIPGGLSRPFIQHQPAQQAPLQIWQRVNTEKPVVETKVLVVATGEALDDKDYEHLATVQLNGGGLVVHVLALIE